MSVSQKFKRAYAGQMKRQRQSEGKEIGQDLLDHFYNIDTILDAIADEEYARGKEPSIEEAVYDNYTGEKFRRFQKRTDEEEERYLLAKGSKPDSEPEDEDDGAESEEEHIYLCGWCSKLGYKKKYIPETCDSCTICAECAEYEHYECSGCSYSRYRTGVPYCERMKASDVLSDEDLLIFSSIRDKTKEHMVYNDKYTSREE